jgi:hypothetical protein
VKSGLSTISQLMDGTLRVPWNLTRRVEKYRAADVIVLSIGKSGRTWLRVLINKYITLLFDLPFSLDDLSRVHAGIPSIQYSHELWEHLSKASFTQKCLGKYLLTDDVLLKKKVILLYRDPRDVLVSLYFHKTRRSERKIRIDLDDFIGNPKDGIHRIVAVLNIWRQRLHSHPCCHWISYEALQNNTYSGLAESIRFIGLEPFSEEMARQAVGFAAFGNMKQMEARGEFDSQILKPSNPDDPNSFKVREGKVGGYRKHFSPEQLRCLDQAVARLDPFFGYSASQSIK